MARARAGRLVVPTGFGDHTHEGPKDRDRKTAVRGQSVGHLEAVRLASARKVTVVRRSLHVPSSLASSTICRYPETSMSSLSVLPSKLSLSFLVAAFTVRSPSLIFTNCGAPQQLAA